MHLASVAVLRVQHQVHANQSMASGRFAWSDLYLSNGAGKGLKRRLVRLLGDALLASNSSLGENLRGECAAQ